MKNYFDEEKYSELKENDNLIYKALEVVNTLFENDVDKGGYPYIIHLMQVYSKVNGEEEKVIALLHDTLEDKDITEEDLLDLGFSKKIVDDVKMLTRKKSDEYQKYIDILVKNGSKEALDVKLSDLTHNMNLSRIKNPTAADFERIEGRYKPAYEKILNRLNEMEK